MMETIETMFDGALVDATVAPNVSLAKRLHNLVLQLRWVLTIRRSRRDLVDLSDDQLRDIGVSRHEAETEARRISLF